MNCLLYYLSKSCAQTAQNRSSVKNIFTGSFRRGGSGGGNNLSPIEFDSIKLCFPSTTSTTFREREGTLPVVSERVQLLSAGSRRCVSTIASRKCAENIQFIPLHRLFLNDASNEPVEMYRYQSRFRFL